MKKPAKRANAEREAFDLVNATYRLISQPRRQQRSAKAGAAVGAVVALRLASTSPARARTTFLGNFSNPPGDTKHSRGASNSIEDTR
jgi:hypothetical protein